MYQLHKETNETHDKEPNPRRLGNHGELLSVGLGALLDEVDRVLGKLPERFNKYFLESFLFHSELRRRYSCKGDGKHVIRMSDQESKIQNPLLPAVTDRTKTKRETPWKTSIESQETRHFPVPCIVNEASTLYIHLVGRSTRKPSETHIRVAL